MLRGSARSSISAPFAACNALREVASGRQKTWAEHSKLRNALVLFNPAPVT